MFFKFLLLQVKTATRSPIWQKNLVLNLVIGIFLLILAVNLLMVGLYTDQIMNQVLPHQDHLRFLNGIILYYLLGDILIRFLAQSLPMLFVESFQHLPIRKGTIIRYMIGRTVFDVFNFLPLFIFIPVTFTIVIPHEGALSGSLWLITLIILILSNNFLAIYLKRLLGVKPLVAGALAALFILLVVLDRINIISLMSISSKIFGYFTHNYLLILVPVAWFFFTYRLQYHFLSGHFYTDEVQKRKAEQVRDTKDSLFLRSKGLTGSLILLEFRLFLRNKRTQTLLYTWPIILLYGLFFYSSKQSYNQEGFLIMVGMMITCGMMMNYGIYTFGFESSYFDGLLTKNIDFAHYIRVKFYIILLISTVSFLLTIPYCLYGVKILLINIAMYFYNIGVLSFALLYFATYNKKRIDLKRGGVFNYQGMGAGNWLSIIPAAIVPFVIYILFRQSGYPHWGIAFIGFLGISGLILNKFLIGLVAKNLHKQKYIMAKNFRER
jgi:hypothetical protein